MREKSKVGLPHIILSLCLSVAAILSGCGSLSATDPEREGPLSISGFAFDTAYTVTLYEGGSQELLDSCVSLCTKYEDIFSTTRKSSELYRIDRAAQIFEEVWRSGPPDGKGKQKPAVLDRSLQEGLKEAGLDLLQAKADSDGSLKISVSQELSELLKAGLFYSKLSEGRFDITIEPVSRLWDFSSGEGRVPEKKQIEAALPYVGYRDIRLDGNTLIMQSPGMGIDLGGIAKGYIADQLKSYLCQNGVTSGLIDLGGNILCIGSKEDGQDFHIGIQQPFADRNEMIAAVSVSSRSIVSSGIYERYITAEDGKLYHHILDPSTGYPYENGLNGVTVISEKSVDGDGLSTTIFALGL